MRHKIKLLFLLLVTFSSTLYAAPVSISGVVVDRVTNEAVIGATIVVEGTTTGSVTSYDGGYTISVEPGQTITFNYLGYVPQSVKIGANTKVDIFLYEDTEQIDEILVVGYGVQKKSSSVGSIAQVSGEDILKAGSTTSISQAIQGAMPGVVATVNSSKPGSEDATVYIRGVASWQDSTPLYLVDGVERDINDIDPNEIESLSVLKDASATAVYGVKGANGVILVTTKRGTVSKPKVNFSTNFGFKKPTNIPEYADYVTTMEMWNEAAANDLAWDSVIPQSTIDAWRQAYASGEVSSTSDYFPEVDWWDEALADYGFSQQYNVNVSGGTEFVKYFASLGYLNDGDIFDAEESDLYDASFYYKRYNWRTNFDFSRVHTLSEEYSGRAVQLRHYYTLRTINDKSTTLGHIWNCAEINILHHYSKILVVVIRAIELQLSLQWHAVTQASLQTLLNRVAWGIDIIVYKFENEVISRICNWEILLKHSVETLAFAILCRGIHLEKISK